MKAVIIELNGAQVIGVSDEIARRDSSDGEYVFHFGDYRLRIICDGRVRLSSELRAEPSMLQTQAHISDTISELTQSPL